MAVIGDLDEAALAALYDARQGEDHRKSTVGMTAAPDATAMEIASAAVVFIVEIVAPRRRRQSAGRP